MMRGWAQVAEVVDPPDPYPPWSPLFYVDICPDWALPWLAQLVGISLPASLTPDQARIVIKQLAQLQRGSPKAIEAVLGLYLTGSKSVYFRERDGDPYILEIVTLASETPDEDQILSAILLQKPGGILLHYRTTAGWDHQALADEHDLHSELGTLYPTHRDLKRGPLT
jgi:hypothetical protein